MRACADWTRCKIGAIEGSNLSMMNFGYSPITTIKVINGIMVAISRASRSRMV